jgi:signal transduction histidine kinase
MRLNFLLVFIVLSLAAAILAFDRSSDGPAAPRAQQGVIDLRGVDLDRQAIVNLDGEWDFYWQRFVAAEHFRDGAAPLPDGLLSLPGAWKGVPIGGQALDATGFATLHLTILRGASSSPLALRLVGFYPANRIWVNGRLASEAGRIARSAPDEVMNRTLQIVALPNDGQAIEIVIQVSNFNLPRMRAPHVEIGRESEINARQVRKWGLALFAVGTLLLMSFYHLALYFFRRVNPAPLYLGLNCLLWTGNILCIGASEWAIRIFLPQAPGEFLFRVWPLCLFLAAPLAFEFFRSMYPREFPRWMARGLWLITLVYAAIAVCAPIQTLAAALPSYYLLTLARMIFSAWALFQAARHGHSGALILFDGYLLMLLLSVNDMLNAAGITHTILVVHLGMIAYMFLQSLALAQRFSALFSSVEALSSDLANKKQTLEQEISERIRLQHEIVSLSEAARRHISHELHDGLCQQLTGARLQCAGLAAMALKGAPVAAEMAKLSMLLDESVEDAYALSRGLWPMALDSDDAGAALSTLVRRQGEASGMAIELLWKSPCAVCACIHAEQIHGIAREAIANALKHAHASRITLTLDCSAEHRATLEIADDGCGSRSGKKSGDGLGLRIMVYRAQMVGGDLSIQSLENGGTCVNCSLPCKTPSPLLS